MNGTKPYIYPLVIIGVIFGTFGFITWVNSILIPYFQIGLQLSNFESFLVTSASYSAYLFMALPSASVLRRTGYRKGMSLGLVIMAIGTFLFIPAALSRIYLVFLVGLFVTGTGMILLQTAVNPYVVLIGPQESAAQRIGFMGFSNKIAGILSQRILGGIFLVDASVIINRIREANSIQKEIILKDYILKVIDPYLVITGILILLAILLFFSSLPEVKEDEEKPSGPKKLKMKGIFHYPYLVLGIIALFVDGACEVIPIDGVIVYARSMGISIDIARNFAEYTLYCMVLGYLGSIIFIPKYISQQTALLLCSIAGISLSISAFFTHGMTSVILIISMGFVSAWLWGTIWGLAIHGLGKYTKTGSAFMLMSVVGGGLFPLIFGTLLDQFTAYPQTAILMLIPCYFYLFFYATKGYKIKSWKNTSKVY